MTTQVKRDGSDDHHRRKTAPVENYPTPMNTVDTERLEQLRTIGVPFAGATNDDIRVFDCRVLLEWATSLTNEAELRGRQSELESLREQTLEVTSPDAFVSDSDVAQSIRVHTNSLIEYRLAALLKSSASSRQPERSQESKPRKEGQ